MIEMKDLLLMLASSSSWMQEPVLTASLCR
jgi:hypothetical protein